jgi:serine/threonine-protein kinase
MVLGGRYTLTRRIAVGGMGEVWAADDGAVGREVALKVLKSEYTGQQEFLRRLRVEARNSSALSHPNIAQMYDYGEQEGTGFLVMELVDGEPLADLLERQHTVDLPRLLPMLAGAARGLDHAHQAGVVHRDVKPGNILLAASTGAVKLTDFGVSMAPNQAQMTATGMVMGTAQYLSPEQAIGKPATARSDMYALGVIAYEATAGKRPFTGKTPVDIAVAHVNAPVPPLPASVDPRWAALVYRMLDKDPKKRWPTAGDLADDLDRLAAQLRAENAGEGADAGGGAVYISQSTGLPLGSAAQPSGSPGSAGLPPRISPAPSRRSTGVTTGSSAAATAVGGSRASSSAASRRESTLAYQAARRRRTRLTAVAVIAALALLIAAITTLTRSHSDTQPADGAPRTLLRPAVTALPHPETDFLLLGWDNMNSPDHPTFRAV